MALPVEHDVAELKDELVATRRDLHMHPELAFQEHRTAGIVASHLEAHGWKVTRGVAKTGVVGLLEGGKDGPTLMIRVDMDALPIQEPKNKPYASKNDVKMHACGHDAHTAIGIITAQLLAKYQKNIRGRVKLVFQPAEETVEGGKAMLEAGVMRAPNVDMVLSVHMWPPLPAGAIVAQGGPLFASVDEVKIVVTGKGGHGGLPHMSVDPIPIAAQVVSTLQSLISRETQPGESAVLGFGTIHGGSQFNIICEEVTLTGNIRTHSEQVRVMLLKRAEEVTAAVTKAMRGGYQFVVPRSAPVLVNDPGVARVVADAARDVVGSDKVMSIPPRAVGDDCSYFLQQAPGCYFLVGCANEARGITAPLHSPQFDIDEEVLPIAARVMVGAALRLLQ